MSSKTSMGWKCGSKDWTDALTVMEGRFRTLLLPHDPTFPPPPPLA